MIAKVFTRRVAARIKPFREVLVYPTSIKPYLTGSAWTAKLAGYVCGLGHSFRADRIEVDWCYTILQLRGTREQTLFEHPLQ